MGGTLVVIAILIGCIPALLYTNKHIRRYRRMQDKGICFICGTHKQKIDLVTIQNKENNLIKAYYCIDDPLCRQLAWRHFELDSEYSQYEIKV